MTACPFEVASPAACKLLYCGNGCRGAWLFILRSAWVTHVSLWKHGDVRPVTVRL